MDDKVFTTKQAAAYLQVSLATMFKLIKKGELKCNKVGRGYRFLKSEIDKYLRGDSDSPHQRA